MINNIIELSGSTRKDKGIFNDPALIQSNKKISCDFTVSLPKAKNMPILITKEINITLLPIKPIRFLDNVFLPRPLMMKPKRGINGTSQTKFIIL